MAPEAVPEQSPTLPPSLRENDKDSCGTSKIATFIVAEAFVGFQKHKEITSADRNICPDQQGRRGKSSFLGFLKMKQDNVREGYMSRYDE